MSILETLAATKAAYAELKKLNAPLGEEKANDAAISSLRNYGNVLESTPQHLASYMKDKPDLQIADKHLGSLARDGEFFFDFNNIVDALDSRARNHAESTATNKNSTNEQSLVIRRNQQRSNACPQKK